VLSDKAITVNTNRSLYNNALSVRGYKNILFKITFIIKISNLERFGGYMPLFLVFIIFVYIEYTAVKHTILH
jgi:hypothetical protein